MYKNIKSGTFKLQKLELTFQTYKWIIKWRSYTINQGYILKSQIRNDLSLRKRPFLFNDTRFKLNIHLTNITATGNLVVEGNTTNAQVANLLVEDRFALFNSGSASGDGSGDGGMIIQTEANFSGVAFGWDQSAGRFGTQVDTKLAQDAVAIAPDAYVASVVTADDATYHKNGNIKVEGGEIYLYVEQ